MIYNEVTFNTEQETFREIRKYLGDNGMDELYPEAYVDYKKQRIGFWADGELFAPFEDLSASFPSEHINVAYMTESMHVYLQRDFYGGQEIANTTEDINEILRELRL